MPATHFYTSDFHYTLTTILEPYRSTTTKILIAGGSILPLFESIHIDPLWQFYLCDERLSPPFNWHDASKYLKAPIQPPHAVSGIKIDLAILGIGEDGHVASLFPNSANLNLDDDIIKVIDSPKLPMERISVGISVLRNVTRLLFLVPRKNGIVKDVRDVHESINNAIGREYEVYLDEEVKSDMKNCFKIIFLVVEL